MMPGPRSQGDYGGRETEAAHRVLLDLGQVLGSYFVDGVVLVGGWIPYLLLPDATEEHVGSIDVDLALDPRHLRDGRYAELVKSLLATGRYKRTDLQFKLQAVVDLQDGAAPIVVDVDFLKPHERRRGKRVRHIENFRPLDADGCAAAFAHPERLKIEGVSIAGYRNRVEIARCSEITRTRGAAGATCAAGVAAAPANFTARLAIVLRRIERVTMTEDSARMTA